MKGERPGTKVESGKERMKKKAKICFQDRKLLTRPVACGCFFISISYSEKYSSDFSLFFNLSLPVVQGKVFLDCDGNFFCKLILICILIASLHTVLMQELAEIFFLKSYICNYNDPVSTV
jgi:hypothetical protein